VNNFKRAFIGTAAAVSMVALGAGVAFAGTDAHALSSSEECGAIGSCILVEHAEGWFYNVGDKWKICDTYADGDRAGISVYWSDSSGNHIRTNYATAGTGSCVTDTVNIPDGRQVTIQVWHQNGAAGTHQDVRTVYGTA
jgi:hypothetical protein